METIDDLRGQMISTAAEFRFDQSRLDAASIAHSGQRRRRRRRVLGSAIVVAIVATAGAALASRDRSRDAIEAVAPNEVYLVPAAEPEGLVLRRSTDFIPQPGWSYFQAVYRDDGDKRIAVATAQRPGVEATTTPPRATATPSGFWMPTSPQPGVEVDVATAGMSRAETEALFERLGVEPDRGDSAYGLVTLPQGFRRVGDERDTSITDGTTNVYARADANIEGQSLAPRASVFIGHTSKTWPEIDPFMYDERTTAKIRGRDVVVITHRADSTHGDIVTMSWFEQPGLLVSIDTYNMSAADAIAFATTLHPVTLDEWTAHRASARG
jgi:hypothetical protein